MTIDGDWSMFSLISGNLLNVEIELNDIFLLHIEKKIDQALIQKGRLSIVSLNISFKSFIIGNYGF